MTYRFRMDRLRDPIRTLAQVVPRRLVEWKCALLKGKGGLDLEWRSWGFASSEVDRAGPKPAPALAAQHPPTSGPSQQPTSRLTTHSTNPRSKCERLSTYMSPHLPLYPVVQR